MDFKKLVTLGLVGTTFTALTACGTKEVAQEPIKVVTELSEPVTIQFWHSMSGGNGSVLSEIVDDFNNTVGKEKGITVEATYQGGYSDSKSKIMASLKAGDSPEIVQGTVNDIMEYVQSGYVQDLDPYIFNGIIGMNGKDDVSDIYKVYRDESKSYSTSGDFYSLPFAKSTDLLFYNKTFFDEHGLEVPQTWEETIEVSKQIQEITGKKGSGFSIDNLSNYLITMLKQLGAGYTNPNGELLFNNETAKEMLELVKEQIELGNWRTAGEDGYSSAPFLSENVYMYVGSSAGTAFLNEDNFDWEATNIPQWDLENQAHIQQGNNVAILNQNKTSDEVYASYEFVKYLVSYEANLKWATNTGYLPLRDSVAQSEDFQNFISDKSDKQSAINAVENGFVESLFANGSLSSGIVRDKIGVMAEDIIYGGEDVQEALNKTVEQLNNY